MMRSPLLLLALSHICIASVANAASPQQDMLRAVLLDRDPGEVERYLKAGFAVQAPIGCGTFDALDGAVEIQAPEMVALLLRYGARPKESTFVRAAFIASPDTALRIVTAFLQAGADVNSKLQYPGAQTGYLTALHQAVWRQNVDLVRLLLSQQYISLNDIDGEGHTPLDIAKDKGNATIVALLLQSGADPREEVTTTHSRLFAEPAASTARAFDSRK